MPFLMPVDRFAAAAARAIDAGASYRVIPWQMGVVAKLLRLLPNVLFDALFAHAPHEGAQGGAMNADRIMSLSTSGVAVEVVAETGSTNADLLARAPTLAGPVLLVAEHQTAGRGRAGRSWLSEPRNSLTFSLAWRYAGGCAAWPACRWRSASRWPKRSAGSASRCS
jgi:hypothetical protein